MFPLSASTPEICAFSTSDAKRDKQADVSSLTRSFVLSKLYSAPAHHEHEAKRNANCIAKFFENLSGDEGIRTPDPLLARQVLSQLSYTPRNNNYPSKDNFLGQNI